MNEPIGDVPPQESIEAEREALSQDVDTSMLQDAAGQVQAILEAAQPVLARIERGARTNNPVGLKGKDAAALFDFIQMQAANHEAAGMVVARLEAELEEARNRHGDWKTDDSGLVVPT